LRKDKTVPAPHSRAARLAAADAKAFAEALSRRDEALANFKRRQDAAVAKK
jgi:predicted HTH domain antitoxin